MPDGNRRSGAGIRSSPTHAYADWGCTPTNRAHAANFTAPVTHSLTNTHIYTRVAEQFATPVDEPLVSRGRIETLDGRKAFLTATMTDADGTVLSEANGLMIKLLPHQP